MKNVLIVDDEQAFLSSAAEGLKVYDQSFSVYTATNGVEALAKLAERAFDLMVTDLKMPVMDGFELLVKVNRLYPKIPVIVITAFGTEEIEERLFGKGILGYLEKPLDIELLAERIFDGLAVSSQEFIQEVFTLNAFMELIRLEKKTCTLVVKSKERTGTLYFLAGELVDTEAGDLSGEDAVAEIMDWDETVINIFNTCDRPGKGISSPIQTMLKRQAEGSRAKRKATRKGKEKGGKVNKELLEKAMGILKEYLGQGLIASDIASIKEQKSVVGYNTRPDVTKLFNRIYQGLVLSLNESELPNLGNYILLELDDEKNLVLLPMGIYRWGFLIDRSQIPLGLLINIAIPNVLSLFEEAVEA